MAHTRDHRTVSIERTSNGRFTITNARNGHVTIGTGDDTDFTPTELFLGALGACTAVDVDILTSRRADPEAFRVEVEADKVRDDIGNHLTDIMVIFKILFPEGKDGDVARAILPDAVEKSHDRLCTVGRTVESGASIGTRID